MSDTAKRSEYRELVAYTGIEGLQEGLDEIYCSYTPTAEKTLINRDFLQQLFVRFAVPEEAAKRLLAALQKIEQDEKLLALSKFLVWDMCAARNRCDCDNYFVMTPTCMAGEGSLYSFLLLLACVEPSEKMLADRGVPKHYYEKIPYQPMKNQFEKLARGEDRVSDFPWDLNFYTCSIFLLDRFFFIPYMFGDPFTMFRNIHTGEVAALIEAGKSFRSDGQYNGVNGVIDAKAPFTTVWEETETAITANYINPMGFCEREPITLLKREWKPALQAGDILLALHIPSGPGYTPEKLNSSMCMAVEFYETYFPELPVKGFWSESWLYDTRLQLVLDEETSNIVKVQNQFYNYPIEEGDGMLRYELYGDWKADYKTAARKTSLQRAAAAYMDTGARFNTLSMIVLKEEAPHMGENPYIKQEHKERFLKTVDSHLK